MPTRGAAGLAAYLLLGALGACAQTPDASEDCAAADERWAVLQRSTDRAVLMEFYMQTPERCDVRDAALARAETLQERDSQAPLQSLAPPSYTPPQDVAPSYSPPQDEEDEDDEPPPDKQGDRPR